jgi:hypothetical protein
MRTPPPCQALSRRSRPGALAAWVLAALALVFTGRTAAAQAGDVETTLAEIAALESVAADPAVDPAERVRASDRAVTLRDVLITLAPDDDRGAIWLIDQASERLSQLSQGGADTALLLSIPLRPQREPSVADRLGLIDSLLDEAKTKANKTLERLNRIAVLDAKQTEALARLATVEQPVRIPFLRARATLLRAALALRGDAPGGVDRARELARAAGTTLVGLVLEPGPAEASRIINLAIASRSCPTPRRSRKQTCCGSTWRSARRPMRQPLLAFFLRPRRRWPSTTPACRGSAPRHERWPGAAPSRAITDWSAPPVNFSSIPPRSRPVTPRLGSRRCRSRIS